MPLEDLVSTTSLESLVKGYLLNCRCEGKSQATLNIYQTVLTNFMWHCSAKPTMVTGKARTGSIIPAAEPAFKAPTQGLTDQQSCGRFGVCGNRLPLTASAG